MQENGEKELISFEMVLLPINMHVYLRLNRINYKDYMFICFGLMRMFEVIYHSGICHEKSFKSLSSSLLLAMIRNASFFLLLRNVSV